MIKFTTIFFYIVIIIVLVLAVITIVEMVSYRHTLISPESIPSVMMKPEPAEVTSLVTVTMYNAVVRQTDSDPLITAGMYNINPLAASAHKWVALSRDLLTRWGGEFDYGDKIQITNAGHKDGIYTVVDTMNERFTNRIDILETEGTQLYKFEDVKIERIS